MIGTVHLPVDWKVKRSMIESMKIGELGRQASVGAKTIRYYEDIGLMPEPNRTPGGYRDYGEDAVERLRFIRDAQATGLSLAEIQSIFDLRDRGEQTCHHVMELLEQHVAAIDRQLLQLRTTRKLLVGMLERAQQLDPADCVDPIRCQTIARDDAGRSARAVRSGDPAWHVHS